MKLLYTYFWCPGALQQGFESTTKLYFSSKYIKYRKYYLEKFFSISIQREQGHFETWQKKYNVMK